MWDNNMKYFIEKVDFYFPGAGESGKSTIVKQMKWVKFERRFYSVNDTTILREKELPMYLLEVKLYNPLIIHVVPQMFNNDVMKDGKFYVW